MSLEEFLSFEEAVTAAEVARRAYIASLERRS